MTQEILVDKSVFGKNDLIIIEKHKAIFTFERISQSELTKCVNDIFVESGYKLEQGTTESGKYGKGSQVMRVLFGAFVKRFCWETKIESNSSQTRFVFIKDAKGYVGGVIGVNQVKNEFKRLTDLFSAFHFSKH